MMANRSAPSLTRLLAWLNRRYRMGVAAIAVIVAALVLLALLDVRASRSLERARKTLQTADRAQVLALDRQFGVRGFLLSGEYTFLEPALADRAPLRAALDTLISLSIQDPAQHAAALALSSAIARWDTAYADRVLTSHTALGPHSAVLDQLARGRVLYAPVRGGFASIIASQHRRRQDEAILERAIRWATLAVAIGALISLAFLLDRRTIAAEASERRVREVLESIPAGFFATDHELCFTYVNPQYEAMSARDGVELVGSPMASVYSAFEGSRFEQHCRDVLQSGRASTFVECEPATGQWLELHAYRTASGGLSVYLRDVTEQRTLEAQFQQAQKMEVVGQLAGGIAHDFNNLLTVIASFTQFALESTPDRSPVRDDLGQVLAATERATSMTRQLLTLSRRQVLQPRVLALTCAIDDLMPMLHRLIPANIRIVRTAAPALGTVWADEHQIGQALFNLALNARDAMPDGGTLVIETSNVQLDGSRTAARRVAALASHVMLAVTDTGMGMDPAIRARLFEPFFTTKPAGKGTGLGLPTVHRIVHQSGGSIEVSSERGCGASFQVYLPRTESEPPAVTHSYPASIAVSRAASILFVEDDPQVVTVARRTLEALGHRVAVASDGDEALRMLDSLPAVPDLLVADLLMPALGGGELATRARARWPELRVLFISACAAQEKSADGMLQYRNAFLSKPFTSRILAQRVTEVLNGRC